MICVHAIVHIPTRVLGIPNQALRPAYTIHTRQVPATPRVHVYADLGTHQPNEDCAFPKMNHGAVAG